MSGDIEARECPGSVEAESASGDVSLKDCGPSSVTTASGWPGLAVQTVSGDISVDW